MRIAPWAPLLLLPVARVAANTEKTIFKAPAVATIPNARSDLEDLCLDTISPHAAAVRTDLQVIFPTQERPRGTDNWYLLTGLGPSRRYEVRVCWPATQPTEFWLDTFTLSQASGTPDLVSALATYSHQRQGSGCTPYNSPGFRSVDESSVHLFLRLNAAADFFTTNKTLMTRPPDVEIDIVLDPYILNLFPRSLIWTGAYLTIVAIGGWLLSGTIAAWLLAVASSAHPTTKTPAD